MSSIDRFIYRLFRSGELERLKLVGRVVGDVTVLMYDGSGNILFAT